MVDTRHLKQARQHCVANQDYEAACACRDAEDELDALRKRCEQIERLVCSQFHVWKHVGDQWGVWEIREGEWAEERGIYETQQAAIDAAIKHMEANQ